jgi:RNA polymerase sigma factor (sigma-70 family)
MVGVTLKGTILENAILEDANLENANLDEAMLVGAWTDRANLSGVTALGALLPPGFWVAGRRSDIEQLTSSLDSKIPSADYVSLLREMYPDMKKTAEKLARYYAVDPDEFVSEIAIYLANPRNLEVLKALHGEDRVSHLRVIMKSVLRQGRVDTARFYPIEAFSEEELDVIMRRTTDQQRNPEDELVLKELISRLKTALSGCPADLVSLLLRKIVDGESVEQIAEQTGKSVTTIYRRIAKAREILLERTREKEGKIRVSSWITL